MPLNMCRSRRTYLDRIDALVALLDAREAQWRLVIAERDRLQARVTVLQTHHDNIAAMRCAHPSCQLRQMTEAG